MIAFDRYFFELYSHLMTPKHRAQYEAAIARLENGEMVEPISGWEMSDWVAGLDMNAQYRLTSDDEIVEVRRSGDCNVGPHSPCTVHHDSCYVEVSS